MASKRPKPEEIVSKLRQVEVLMGQGMPRLDAIRQIGVVEQTYYRWRKQYGGMGVDQQKELKRRQKENDRLRRAVSDLTLDKLILTKLQRETSEPRSSSCLYRSRALPVQGIGTQGVPCAGTAPLDTEACPKGPCR